MDGLTIVKQVIKIIQQKNKIEAEDFGEYKEGITENIILYKPKIETISNIVAYYSDARLVKISFAGEKLNIRLSEMISFLGEYKLAYNFRDNFSQFSFNMVHNLSPKINRILLKKDNNIKYNSDNKTFIEITPQGEETKYTADEFYLNNFTIELVN